MDMSIHSHPPTPWEAVKLHLTHIHTEGIHGWCCESAGSRDCAHAGVDVCNAHTVSWVRYERHQRNFALAGWQQMRGRAGLLPPLFCDCYLLAWLCIVRLLWQRSQQKWWILCCDFHIVHIELTYGNDCAKSSKLSSLITAIFSNDSTLWEPMRNTSFP